MIHPSHYSEKPEWQKIPARFFLSLFLSLCMYYDTYVGTSEFASSLFFNTTKDSFTELYLISFPDSQSDCLDYLDICRIINDKVKRLIRDITADHGSQIIFSWLSTPSSGGLDWCQHSYPTQSTYTSGWSLVQLPGIAQSCSAGTQLSVVLIFKSVNRLTVFTMAVRWFLVRWNPPLAVTSNNWSFK